MPSILVLSLTQILVYLSLTALVFSLIGLFAGRTYERVIMQKELELLYILAAEGAKKDSKCGGCSDGK